VYKEGDLVLIWKPLSPSIKDFRKFKNCYSGPWKIVKVLSTWTYLVRHMKTTSKQCVVHFDTMKLIPTDLRNKFEAPGSAGSSAVIPEEGSLHQLKDDDIAQLMLGTSTAPTTALPEIVRTHEVEQTSSSRSENVSTNTSRYDLRPRKRVIYSR
jgi:hypothetical protein